MIVTVNRSFRGREKTAFKFFFFFGNRLIVENLIKKKTTKIIVFFFFFFFCIQVSYQPNSFIAFNPSLVLISIN
jgi:hypothetical protein